MVYKQRSDLPEGITNNLPKHAQDIYIEAFNSAHQQHEEEDDVESASHRIAWSAVKQVYEKNDNGNWHKKE